MANRVQVLREVTMDPPGDWQLHLQWARYVYDDGRIEHGYRFIYRREDGSLQGARGQARIPSLDVARKLMDMANTEGWGDEEG